MRVRVNLCAECIGQIRTHVGRLVSKGMSKDDAERVAATSHAARVARERCKRCTMEPATGDDATTPAMDGTRPTKETPENSILFYNEGGAYAAERVKVGDGTGLLLMMWGARLAVAQRLDVEDPFARGVVDRLVQGKEWKQK